MIGIGHLFYPEVNKIGEEGIRDAADAYHPDRADIFLWDKEKCALLSV